MSNTTTSYKVGDEVIVTDELGHSFRVNQRCRIVGAYVDGFCELELIGGDFTQTVHPRQFRPVTTSYPSLESYRERDRVPTDSEGDEGQHTEQMI
jgi:hypothetical protein